MITAAKGLLSVEMAIVLPALAEPEARVAVQVAQALELDEVDFRTDAVAVGDRDGGRICHESNQLKYRVWTNRASLAGRQADIVIWVAPVGW